MKSEDHPEISGQTYREFSRQKYNKYKHQFPRLRESEVIAKIIREWNAMPTFQKRALAEKYKALEVKHFADDSPGSQTHKGYNVADATPTPPQFKSLITPPSKLNKQKREESQEGRESERHSDRMSMRSSVSNGISSSRHKKKKAKKGPLTASGYVRFYRQNFARLSWEHPRWEASQINQIIRLLWHKQKQEKKVELQPVRSKPIKKVSGRTLFTREKRRVGYDLTTIHRIWSQLTHESKVGFNLRGAGQSGAPLFPHNVVTLEPDSPEQLSDSETGLGFMHRAIEE